MSSALEVDDFRDLTPAYGPSVWLEEVDCVVRYPRLAREYRFDVRPLALLDACAVVESAMRVMTDPDEEWPDDGVKRGYHSS